MTSITFTKQDGAFVSEAIPGNVNVQLSYLDGQRHPVFIDTRLDSSLPWAKYQNLVIEGDGNVCLPNSSGSQQYRFRDHTAQPTAHYDAIVAPVATIDGDSQVVDSLQFETMGTAAAVAIVDEAVEEVENA
jgi:hypothetical protein